MRVAIFGSRDLTYEGKRDVMQYVRSLQAGDVVISGGARGTDRIAERAALSLQMQVVSFRPVNMGGAEGWAIERLINDPWQNIIDAEQSTILPGRYPGFAPAAFVRNGYIVEWAEGGACFWDGVSKGTKDTLRKAQQAFGVNGVELFPVERPGPNRKVVT